MWCCCDFSLCNIVSDLSLNLTHPLKEELLVLLMQQMDWFREAEKN